MMKIKIVELYEDGDGKEFKFPPEAWAYYQYREKESKGKWLPLIFINRKMISPETLHKMCRKAGI